LTVGVGRTSLQTTNAMHLRDYLNTHNIGPREFARRIQRSPSYVYDLVAGKYQPSLEAFREIQRETSGAVTMEGMLEGAEEGRKG